MTIATARSGSAERTPGRRGELLLALPEPHLSMSQDEEWCVIRDNGRWRQVRFHDYHELYSVPGLYERVFYDILRCDSPRTIRRLLEAELADSDASPETLRVLDLGAGNGMVGEEMVDLGAKFVVGVDVLEEAAEAARRDRPEVYDDYLVVDMTDLDPGTRRELADCRFNALACVAALGFGDIPTEAFQAAFDLVRPGGWVAFNIKEDFLNGRDSSGFADLIRTMSDEKVLDIRRKKRYPHRLGIDRQPLHYVAIVGRKMGAATRPAADD